MATPVVESSTANNATGGAAVSGSTAATSHNVTLPATVSPNALLIVVGRCAGAGTVSFPAGWTLAQDSSDASDDVSFWAYKNTYAVGNEDATTISVSHTNSNKMVAIAHSITGAADPATTPPTASTVAVGTGSNPGPTASNPGTTKTYLWMAVGMADGEHTSPPGTIPASYGGSLGSSTGTAGAVGINATTFTATRALVASSEDPGTWTTSVAVNSGWTAWTLAIHPVPLEIDAQPTSYTVTGVQADLVAPVAPIPMLVTARFRS